jgi:hypothetical protein
MTVSSPDAILVQRLIRCSVDTTNSFANPKSLQHMPAEMSDTKLLQGLRIFPASRGGSGELVGLGEEG